MDFHWVNDKILENCLPTCSMEHLVATFGLYKCMVTVRIGEYSMTMDPYGSYGAVSSRGMFR